MPAETQREMHHENQADIATLKARVHGVESDVHDIKEGMNSLRSEMAGGITLIQTKLEARSSPQYALMISFAGLLITGFTVVGWLAMQPIKDGQRDLKEAFVKALDDAKQDRKDAVGQSIDRDRQIWNAFNPLQRQVDRMEGELRARRLIAP